LSYQRSVVGTILIAQVIVTCAFAVCLIVMGKEASLSALIGGFICVIPNIYLARKLTSKRSADVSVLKNNLYAAEFGKILITFALFAGVFATQEWIHPVALLAGFGLAQLTHWLTPVVISVFNKNRD
jgi:ATP synthase protein I